MSHPVHIRHSRSCCHVVRLVCSAVILQLTACFRLVEFPIFLCGSAPYLSRCRFCYPPRALGPAGVCCPRGPLSQRWFRCLSPRLVLYVAPLLARGFRWLRLFRCCFRHLPHPAARRRAHFEFGFHSHTFKVAVLLIGKTRCL